MRKVHLLKSDLEMERVIRPAFCHSGAGTVGGSEKEKQKAEMKKKKWIYISRSSSFYSNIIFLKSAYCDLYPNE